MRQDQIDPFDEDLSEEAVQAGLRLLVHREHSRLELSRKLATRGYAMDVVQSALDSLEQQGVLNESRFVEQYLHSRMRKGYGPVRIRRELEERGLAHELIRQRLDESGIDWFGQMREAAEQKFGASAPGDYKEQAKRARFLEYRGFDHEMIRSLLWG